MLPDFSEYNWVIPDFVWELSEQIDLGKCGPFNVMIQPFFFTCFLLDRLSIVSTDKLAKALPEIEEIAKLLPDLDKIGENFTFLKSLLSSGE